MLRGKEIFKLKPRLAMCASMVGSNVNVLIDVGTDHAYLPIYLVKEGMVDSSIALDRLEGPLLNAKRNIEKYGLQKKIKTIISNGLKNVTPQKSGTIVMSGIGAENIVNIIKEAKWLKNSEITLILQPMTKEEIVREFLANNFFKVLEERIVIDSGKVYVVFKVRFFGEDQSYLLKNLDYPFFGHFLKSEKTKDVKLYIEKQSKRLRKKLNGNVN